MFLIIRTFCVSASNNKPDATAEYFEIKMHILVCIRMHD